jgi:N-acetylglucosaminyldiphosphoundecaprenol N-acetyl-beta-D-mannosaminyltransferase
MKDSKNSKNDDKRGVEKGLSSVPLFEIGVSGSSLKGVITEIESRIEVGQRVFVATPNPEFIIYAQAHPWFKKCLQQADINIPDGVGLVLASWLISGWKKRIKQRVAGADLVEQLCRKAAEKGQSVYLIGGLEGVAEQALAKLKERYPKLIGWTETGPKLVLDQKTGEWDGESRRELTESLCSINQKNPDFLFVAMGMGKQEKFICDLWPDLKVGVAVGVGGTFDYLSGRVSRAPGWVRFFGFEWLFRLTKEPWRWRRQTALVNFARLVMAERAKKFLRNSSQ